MKLAALDIIITAPPAPGWGGRSWIFTKVTTDNGLIGWGECYATTTGPTAMTHIIRDVFERYMLGENPENIELMYRRTYSSGFTQRPDLTVMGAFSGLEMACWDILGKAHNRPVHALLGGKVNDTIRAYTYLYPTSLDQLPGYWIDPDMAAESAAACVARGYTAVKFDPAGPYTIRAGHQPSMQDITRSTAFCTKIREAVGDRADLLFGTHGQFSTGGAIRMAQAIAPAMPLWFEEPIPPDNFPALAEVTRASAVPVAVGERLTTPAEFAAALAAGAQILQPALGRCGGIWAARKIGILAESYNAQLAPHLYAGPIEWAANIQLAASLPNVLMAESIETDFHSALVKGGLKVENGFIAVPTGPGLGIDVDEALARANPYDGDGLHLEMSEAPVSYHEANVFEGGAPPKL